MRRAKPLIIASAATLILGAAACHPVEHRNPAARLFTSGPITVADRLACPDSVHELSRTDAAPDGQRCDYKGPDGEQVTLTRMALDGRTPAAALGSVEADLKGSTGLSSIAGDQGVHIDAGDHGDGDGDHAHIDLPGLHIDADNGKARVHIPGLTVNANGDDAEVHTGWGPYKNTVLHANDGGAEIRAGDVTANGADLVYVLSGKPGASGYRATGYIARGPAAGPLVVAQFKAMNGGGHDRWTHNGLDALVNMNLKR